MSLSDLLLYAVHHVFLPPQLPQEDDQTADRDRFLCELISQSIVAYQRRLPDSQKSQWDPILRMVDNLTSSQASDVLSAETIERQISHMRAGGTVIHCRHTKNFTAQGSFADTLTFLIRAQNAGVILRKLTSQTGTVFEAFEVAPPAAVVMAAKGKLLCSYPGPAVEIPSDVVNDPVFRKEFASFLSQMHVDVLDSAATSRKAGSTVVEERDTAHPRYITQLLTGILRGIGKAANVTRIRKRVADDVLWNHALHPWRRSSLWLVLRVALQTTLYDDNSHNADYKAFLVFAMARMLRDSLGNDLPSDVLFCMRAKVSRRLYKLGSAAPEFVLEEVGDVGEAVEELLQKRWLEVQDLQAQSPCWAPADLDIPADTRLSLHNSAPYLSKVLQSKSSPASSAEFEPHHSPRFRSTFIPESFTGNGFVSLADLELLVQDDLDNWVEQHIHTSSIDSVCVKLADCIEAYHNAAHKLYGSNPEDMSLMLLTLFELWVALDKLVVADIPLLADYSPEIPPQMLESLLLRKAKSIQRLASIVDYLRQRHRRALHGYSIFTSEWSNKSFAVRYFGDSQDHQTLKSRIENDATAQRARKVEEMHRKKAEHERLLNQARSMSCTYQVHWRGYKYHEAKSCEKCSLENQADSLRIDVHEWPLSQYPNEAMATVFELQCPIPFGVWRTTTHKLLFDICTPSQNCAKTEVDPALSLSDYPGLQMYYREPPPQAQRITLASSTKSFIHSHYRYTSIPTTEQSVCVNNGLQLALFDSSEDVWASDCFADVSITDICTFRIPSSSPYKCLQYAIDTTTHTSNEVIANQSDCHKDLNLHEYIAFASLRAGGRLQWLNIARELPARTLTFRCEEVASLLKQAAWQIGPLSDQRVCDWHKELENAQFGSVLLDKLDDLLQNIKANWLEAVSMRTIIILTSRLLASTTLPSIIDRACLILRKGRDVVLGWMRQLTKQLQENEDDKRTGDIQQCLCEMAITCRSTYDVDPVHLDRLLMSTEDVAVLLECAMVVHDNRSPEFSTLPPTFKILVERDRRLSHALEPKLTRRIECDRVGLDRAIASIWTEYRAGTEWCHRPSPNDRWISSTTAPRADTAPQRIDFNLLDGRLLIDGKPLGRLPQEIMGHPTYVRIFGRVRHRLFLT